MKTLDLVKERLGIRSNVRDEYLASLIEAVKNELLNRQKITIDEQQADEQMFLVDYVVYRYQNVGDLGQMPKHLHWRLKNLFIKKR